MTYLEKRREELNYSQLHAAQATGLSRSQYQRIESGQTLASEAQAAALEALLGVPVVSEKHLIQPSLRRDLARPDLFQVENLGRATWNQASRAYGTHGLDSRTWGQLGFFFHTDSALECSALSQIAAAGATIRFDSPLLWGFRQHPPVDQNDRFLGAAHLPCLFYDKDKVTLVIWPQLRFRPTDVTWRLDALVFYRQGTRRRWLTLEFDGRGHDTRNDLYRAYQIHLPEVRISGDEVVERRVFELLLERAPLAQLPDFSPLRK